MKLLEGLLENEVVKFDPQIIWQFVDELYKFFEIMLELVSDRLFGILVKIQWQ